MTQESPPKTDHTMPHLCPLCGNEKNRETLFCDSCTKKLRAEYEVDLPQSEQQHPGPSTGEVMNEEVEVIADKGSKGSSPILWIFISLLLLVVAFFLYNELIRKGNLERSGWDAATKANSVAGYLHYIENHPDGAHFADAETALMRLKADEANQWEAMKHSDRITELRDFLRRFPDSYYAPLVKRRLDSLSWMGALHSNSAVAYSDYMMMAKSGEFKGDYLTEAESRYHMLFQAFPVDMVVMDSIRVVVRDFCAAYSSLDYAKLEQRLAPRLQRFFNRGHLLRERLLGELLMDAAQSGEAMATYIPDLEGVQYEKTPEESYLVNVPFLKSANGSLYAGQLPGYILHLELNPESQITAVYESRPYPGAP